MNSHAFLLMILLCILCSCSATKNENMKEVVVNKIVQEYVDKTTKKEDVDEMKKLLQSNIEEWIVKYSSMGFYKEENYNISDIMIFGKDKDKVLIIVHALLADSSDGEAKLITAFLGDDDVWEFRFTGLPSFYYEYNEEARKGVKFTEQEILSRTIDNLVEDGLVTFYDEISQDYIKNKWF